jgi:tRNA(Ile)-lysidine synthase TilS/MesJ
VTFPGIRFDANGVCQHCRSTPGSRERAGQKARLRGRFETVVRQLDHRPGYHCLVSWSGGKDSTYALWLLSEHYGLRVLALTFDNGFLSPTALKNARVVAENLRVDHVVVKPRFDLLREIFVRSLATAMYPPQALKRASSICISCMALAKGIGLRTAFEKEIPVLAYGWSPGQIPMTAALFRTNPRMLAASLKVAKEPLRRAVGDEIDVYFPEARHLANAAEFPYNVSPLVFGEYDEAAALQRIQTLAWERPPRTDPNSTNCLLNSFANAVHIEQMGYHPYAMELAGLVRGDYMSRETALDRLETEASREIVDAVGAKLGLAPADVPGRGP